MIAIIHLAKTNCVWRFLRSRYPKENSALKRLHNGNATLLIRQCLKEVIGEMPYPREAASRLVSGKLLLVCQQYLNISYGKFAATFHPKEEVEDSGSKIKEHSTSKSLEMLVGYK